MILETQPTKSYQISNKIIFNKEKLIRSPQSKVKKKIQRIRHRYLKGIKMCWVCSRAKLQNLFKTWKWNNKKMLHFTPGIKIKLLKLPVHKLLESCSLFTAPKPNVLLLQGFQKAFVCLLNCFYSWNNVFIWIT